MEKEGREERKGESDGLGEMGGFAVLQEKSLK